MLWLRTWQLGVKSLLLHPMRSLLTVLGIFIGVASVIWLLAIGEGISLEAQRQIAGLGAKNIIIRSVKPPSEVTAGTRGLIPYGVTRDDFTRLVATLPTVESAIPIREIRRQFNNGDHKMDGRLVGCTPEYQDVTDLKVALGRFLTTADNEDEKLHCVLADSVAKTLFPHQDPIGRQIHMMQHKDYYTVVGVLEHRTATAAVGGSLAAQDFASDVYIPIKTVQQRIGDQVLSRGSGSFEGEIVELNQITLRLDSVDNVLRTAKLIELSLTNHAKMQDVAIVVPLELLEQARATRLMFMIFMGLIAAISLLVGGIGIMNIMLATVTERTREIGIRRALGAKQGDIVRQFLVETVALSVAGGAVGVLGGILCPFVVTSVRGLVETYSPEFFAKMPEVAQTVTPVLVRESIPLAFCISVAIGVVFGLYPASRAAKMDPIEALRHE